MVTAKARMRRLAKHGWKLVEQRNEPDDFGNGCLVVAKDAIMLRLLLDRGFEHVDLARVPVDPGTSPVAAQVEWVPLEVAALGAKRIDGEAVRESYSTSACFDHETGEAQDAVPLIQDPLVEVLENEEAYADILTNGAKLAEAEKALAAITVAVLDGVEPDLLTAP